MSRRSIFERRLAASSLLRLLQAAVSASSTAPALRLDPLRPPPFTPWFPMGDGRCDPRRCGPHRAERVVLVAIPRRLSGPEVRPGRGRYVLYSILRGEPCHGTRPGPPVVTTGYPHKLFGACCADQAPAPAGQVAPLPDIGVPPDSGHLVSRQRKLSPYGSIPTALLRFVQELVERFKANHARQSRSSRQIRLPIRSHADRTAASRLPASTL